MSGPEGNAGRSQARRDEGDSYFNQPGRARRGLDSLSLQASRQISQTLSHRPQPSSIQSPTRDPASPRTPFQIGRSFSSSFNSPRQDFIVSDEQFVFEFGTRFLRVGLGGEKQPRCEIDFGPDTQRRAGDYSRWLPGHRKEPLRKSVDVEQWGTEYELWQMDLRNTDRDLVRNKIERAIRDALVNHVLVVDDSKKRTYSIAVPTLFPHPLLSVILTAMFNLFPPPPSISLLTQPLLSTIAAGLRSGLVIDIGWRATNVTALYEYREVLHRHTSRAMRLLHWEVAQMLNKHALTGSESSEEFVSFEESEEVLHRMTWCRLKRTSEDEAEDKTMINVPLRCFDPPRNVQIPFEDFSRPPESGLFAPNQSQTQLDDDELPLHLLAFDALLSLPVDVRGTCSERIMITGGGSNIPGLKSRLLGEISSLIETRGWDAVHNYGSAPKPTRKTAARRNGPVEVQPDGPTNKDMDPDSTAPPHLQPPLSDPVIANIQARAASSRPPADAETSKSEKPRDHAHVRGIESLGPWAGASLMAGLRLRSNVEIERETFLQHGLVVPPETETEKKRQSMAPQQVKRGSWMGRPGDRSSGTWTLGVFA